MKPVRTDPATAALLGLALVLGLGSPCWADKTITGTVRYLDAFYAYSPGPPATLTINNTTAWLPVRQAEVEVTNGSSTQLTTTDGSGTYTVTLTGTGLLDVTVTVYARRLSAKINTRVLRSDNTQYTATATSAGANFDDAAALTVNLDVGDATPEHRAAFNIFDVSALGFEHLDALLSGTLTNPPLLTLHWQAGSTQGTYTDTGTNVIWLLGTSSDNDAFDDDIILHEFGHYVAVNFSRDDSPGGTHSLTGHYAITLTWSEGWAHLWSAATRRWANAGVAPLGRYPEYRWQIDTYGASGFGAWDIGGPSFPSQTLGADNEVAVAAILWDIATGAADGGTLNLGSAPIWDVVHVRFASRYTPLTNERFVTLEDFRDEWTAAYTAPADDIGPLLLARGVRYLVDALEPNDASASATSLDPLPAAGVARTVPGLTFFKSGPDTSGSNPVGDEDWFSFTALANEQFRIETTGLGDGADTYLQVYDAALTRLAFDDDSGGGLASLLTVTVPADGTYYVKVSPYPGDGPYPAATQMSTYGSYTLSVTSNGIIPPPPPAPASGGGHHHGCGSIGLDLMAPAALLWLLRRRRDRRRGAA